MKNSLEPIRLTSFNFKTKAPNPHQTHNEYYSIQIFRPCKAIPKPYHQNVPIDHFTHDNICDLGMYHTSHYI